MLMKTDKLGIPRFSNKDLIDMIYTGHVDKCHVVLCDPSDDIDKFNEAMRDQYLPELKQYIPIDVEQKDNIASYLAGCKKIIGRGGVKNTLKKFDLK